MMKHTKGEGKTSPFFNDIDILSGKMYNYLYNDGTVIEAVESKVQLNEDNFVTSKTVINTVRYVYDNEGKLTKKRIFNSDGEQVVTYQTAENDSQLVKTTVGEHSFVSTSKTDSFGRKEFDELQLERSSLYRRFDYLAGEATEEHIDNKLHKSTPTTQLVSKITFSDGRTIEYEYDAEERITKVTDSIEGVTEYTYDALGQLLTETKNGQAVNTMTYDNYGNILTKNGVSYSYDTVWKDKLTSVGSQSITYDAQGNPLNYLGHTLTWEKGRQLKSFDGIQYTYNANGIRTSKTVDGIRHDFYLDSGKILKEVWNGNVLEAVFDNEDSVCGIVYNGTPYYFQKNLQGDTIAITNKDGDVVARYTYDAWGVCTVDPASTNTTIANLNPYRYRGYYYDSEIGMYYLQSRYYDPNTGRFVNGDEATNVEIISKTALHNLYTYCCNNPVILYDSSGFAIETVFDIASAVWSLIDLIKNPSWSNFGFLIWDLASIILPFIPGSYVAKGGKIVVKVASKIDDFADGTKYLTNTYKKLKKLYKGYKNIEIHHLVEKRFKNLFKNVKNVNDYLSIPLTKDLHKIITKRWRKIFPYGMKYSKITKKQMRNAIKKVYSDMPQLLEETLEWFEKNWKK